MESTEKYWVPVFNLPEDEINVIIANAGGIIGQNQERHINQGFALT